MSFLIDLIPAAARKWLYGVLSFAAAVYAVWQGVDGDWRQFVIALVTALVGSLATANTNAPQNTPDE